MRIELPQAIPSNLTYTSLEVQNLLYLPESGEFKCRVYGVAGGTEVMPLIINTPHGIERIEDVVITDAEIDAAIAAATEANPEAPELTRTQGAMAVAMTRLYAKLKG